MVALGSLSFDKCCLFPDHISTADGHLVTYKLANFYQCGLCHIIIRFAVSPRWPQQSCTHTHKSPLNRNMARHSASVCVPNLRILFLYKGVCFSDFGGLFQLLYASSRFKRTSLSSTNRGFLCDVCNSLTNGCMRCP